MTAGAGLLLVPATGAAQSDELLFPLRVVEISVFGADAALGSAIAGRLAPDGTLYVVDYVQFQIAAFTPDGELMWKRGRRGSGPAEFQLPYRVDVRPDGTVLVFDFGAGEIVGLSAIGEHRFKAPLPYRFYQMDNFVSISNEEFVAAGVLDLDPPGNQSALHRFRVVEDSVQYVDSFGPLPNAYDPGVLQYWGAGSISLASDGTLLYARRLPYEIYRFDPRGGQRQTFRTPVRLTATPDDFLTIERTAAGVTVSPTDSRSQRPGPLLEIGDGWVLATRVSNGADFWDLYNPHGEPAGSRVIPEEWGGFLGYDAERSVIWMTGKEDGRAVLFRIRVSLEVRS